MLLLFGGKGVRMYWLKKLFAPLLTRIVLFYGLRNEFHPSNQNPPTTTMDMNWIIIWDQY